MVLYHNKSSFTMYKILFLTFRLPKLLLVHNGTFSNLPNACIESRRLSDYRALFPQQDSVSIPVCCHIARKLICPVPNILQSPTSMSTKFFYFFNHIATKPPVLLTLGSEVDSLECITASIAHGLVVYSSTLVHKPSKSGSFIHFSNASFIRFRLLAIFVLSSTQH